MLALVALGPLTGASLGCGDKDDRCAQVQAAGDPRQTGAVCGQQFRRWRQAGDGLAALRALAEVPDLAGAVTMADALEGTEAEGEGAVALAELYVNLDPPEAGQRLTDRRQRLAGRGQFAAAATVARLQGRWAGWEKNRYLDALEAFDLSVQYAERAGDAVSRRKALRGMFNMLYDLGDLRGASRCLAEASRGAGIDERTRALLALDRGMLADAEEQPALARAAFEEVLRSPASRSSQDIAWNTTLNLLDLVLRSEDLPTANRLFADIERIFQAGQNRRAPARIARGRLLARLQLLRNDPGAALAAIAALAKDKPTEDMAWELALERAKAHRQLGQTTPAIAAIEEALGTIEKLRGDQADDFKSWVLAHRREPFEQLFELHLQRKDVTAAVDVLERVKGRTFLDAFAATAAGTAGQGRVVDAANRIGWLRRIYPALRRSPVTAAATVPTQRLLQGHADVRAIAYLEVDQVLHLVALRGDAGAPRTFRAQQSLGQIKALVTRVLADPGAAAPLADLSRALLPAGALPAAGEVLYLMPSPSLARVPFPALRHAGRALIERHVLAQVPSLNALSALRALPAPAPDGPAVVMANAGQDLPEAALEATQVTRWLGGAPRVRLFLGPQASSSNLQAARGASVLHFALHSGVGASGPWLGLADRALASAELLDHPLGAGLVVLASCASAATPDPGLWGSLAASFLASGTRAVVGALWSTGDQASRQLVDAFYAQGGATTPARALARAQRAFIAQGRPARDWAGFAFFGAAESASAPLARNLPR